MSQFYDSLVGLVSEDKLKKIAKTLDEKPENVEKAVSAIVPSLLAIYLKTHNPDLNNVIRVAGNLNIVDSIGDVCKDELSENQAEISDNFLQKMIGDRAVNLTEPIAKYANISNVAANNLIYRMAVVVAGYLGERLKKDKWSESHLLEQIRKAKPGFASKIPAGVVNAFDLSYILRNDITAKNSANPTKPITHETKKKSNNWLIWLLIILLLLLLFFGWRSCKNEVKKETVDITHVITTEIEKEIPDLNELKFTNITLPDGQKIRVKKGGVEEKMAKFLESDEYKNASNADLAKKWFEFEDIDFEFGSGTELIAGSEAEINNIVAILKSHKDIKIQLAGFADKKGSEAVNMNISKQRAKTIESIFEQKGLGSKIVKVEGEGEKYAIHSESETDTQRAPDRDFALWFVK